MVQEDCHHPDVIEGEGGWSTTGLFLGVVSSRLCRRCGLEEHNARSLWPGYRCTSAADRTTNYSQPTQLNGEALKVRLADYVAAKREVSAG